VLSRTWRTH